MYNINDKNTQSVAESVKEVIENKKDFKPHMMYDPETGKGYEAKTYEDHLKMKDMGYTHEKPSKKNETEVQDSDKDFVDTHTVDAKEDPEKKRQVEEKEEDDDVEEGNAFGQAVTDAKKAGKKKFKFQGKEYKVESVDLEEATMSQGVKTAQTQIYSLEKSLKVGSNLNKGVNKSLEGKYDADFKKMQKAIGQIINVWEEIERDFSVNESTDLEEAVDNFFGFPTKDKLVKFQSMAKKLKIKSISNPTVLKRGGKEFHVMGFEGSVSDIEKAMRVADGIIKESAELEEMFNRLKPDDVRDAYGTIELKYRSSADIRDAEDKLKKAGINVRKNRDTLEVDSDSPAFKKAKITSTFDSSKREKAIMKVLGESVELQEASFNDIEKVIKHFKDFFKGKQVKRFPQLDISKKYGTAFINLTITNIITLRLGGKKGIVVTHDDRTNGKGNAKEEHFSNANEVIKFVEKKYNEMPKKESIEEALKPADFVKGGDAKVTKREVDGMLSKLFIDTKLAKAVEANAAYQDGYKGKVKNNPFDKDTADFHLFILGQQSADAE
jgi:hypothetical protein